MKIIYVVGFYRLVLKDGYRYIVQFRGVDHSEWGSEQLGRYAVDSYFGM